MNNLNNSNLKELVISTFQEILAEDPNFFLTDRLSVLTWKSKKIAGALITKIGNVRYLGLLRKDSQGQEYWKYKPLTNSNPEPSGEEKEGVNNSELSQKENQVIPDNIAKFQHRQIKNQQINHGESNNSNQQSINE